MNIENSIFSISVESPCRLENAKSYKEITECHKVLNTNDWFKKPSPIFRRNTINVLVPNENKGGTDSKDMTSLYFSTKYLENKNIITKLFWTIISGKKDEDVDYFCGIKGILCLLVVFMLGSIQLLIPKHNVVQNPGYWYELPISYVIENCFGLTLFVIFASSIVFKTSYTLSWKAFWYIFICSSLSYVCPHLLLEAVWVYWSNYNAPVPFIGYICGVFGYLGSCVSLYTVFPLSWHRNGRMKKRLRALLTLVLLFGLTSIEYVIISFCLGVIPREYQFILALFLPITKHVTEKVVLNVAYVASGGRDDSTKFVASCIVVTGYKIFLVLLVKSSSSKETSYTILVSEFLINMYLCLKIVWTHHRAKIRAKVSTAEEIVGKLALKETIECMAPLTYIITFVMAYYGPNGSIIGSIQNSYWHYTAVKDVEKLLWHTSLFCIIDASSAVIASLLLWTLCKIDFYLAYCKMINKYWWITSLILVTHLYTVSKLSRSSIIKAKLFYFLIHKSDRALN